VQSRNREAGDSDCRTEEPAAWVEQRFSLLWVVLRLYCYPGVTACPANDGLIGWRPALRAELGRDWKTTSSTISTLTTAHAASRVPGESRTALVRNFGNTCTDSLCAASSPFNKGCDACAADVVAQAVWAGSVLIHEAGAVPNRIRSLPPLGGTLRGPSRGRRHSVHDRVQERPNLLW
jgi:hypothetical protein